MLKRTLAVAVLVSALPLASDAQSLRGESLYRTTLLRAAPGRLLELIAALKARGFAGPASKALLLRHAQGDHWDLMLLQPLASYADVLGAGERPTLVAAPELIAWQEDEMVRGPALDALPGFREASLYHAEMFHALADKRAELLKEREMENAYSAALLRPQNAIFVREIGGAWDCFTLGPYKSWKHYAERDDITKDKSAAAAKAAGFAGDDQLGPYLRSLILDHHDSLLTPVR